LEVRLSQLFFAAFSYPALYKISQSLQTLIDRSIARGANSAALDNSSFPSFCLGKERANTLFCSLPSLLRTILRNRHRINSYSEAVKLDSSLPVHPNDEIHQLLHFLVGHQ